MTLMKTALFDFDGVIVDTEPIYDLFWNEAAQRYNLGIDNFAELIKGTTLPYLLETYFSKYPKEIQQKVCHEATTFESKMDLPPMPGSIEFLRLLKDQKVRMGLVTSSDLAKVNRAIEMYQLEDLFDTIVTADRITKGKPDPMCYLLAASDLAVSPPDCLVFEDSFAGIQAGTAAGMRVIGLSTTNSPESLKDKVYKVIPNFSEVSFDDFLQW
ncbi:HAD family phosphatase [Parabacteroides sp. PF5-9]|uniref:HAD family hydrolase n=1 Tax=Parabacteroides sp. PF5-9 TaxID=1742404 RepID=UPI00247644C5|nr:HAD family phosphatase [Parabacteroides sp. PF5-9]MDH6356439.1 beta-phosphoglucomutase [Parabacteroides sp. PF5-9]